MSAWEKNMEEKVEALEAKFDVWRNEANNMITELKLYIDEHIKEIHTRSHNQAKPPSPTLYPANWIGDWNEPLCDDCVCKGNYEIFMCPTKEKCIIKRDWRPKTVHKYKEVNKNGRNRR